MGYLLPTSTGDRRISGPSTVFAENCPKDPRPKGDLIPEITWLWHHTPRVARYVQRATRVLEREDAVWRSRGQMFWWSLVCLKFEWWKPVDLGVCSLKSSGLEWNEETFFFCLDFLMFRGTQVWKGFFDMQNHQVLSELPTRMFLVLDSSLEGHLFPSGDHWTCHIQSWKQCPYHLDSCMNWSNHNLTEYQGIRFA